MIQTTEHPDKFYSPVTRKIKVSNKLLVALVFCTMPPRCSFWSQIHTNIYFTTTVYYKVHAIGCNQVPDLPHHHWHLDFSPNTETVTHVMLQSTYISDWMDLICSSTSYNYDAEVLCRSDQQLPVPQNSEDIWHPRKVPYREPPHSVWE